MNEPQYRQVYAWDNLLLAHRKAARGKRGKAPAARFEYRLEDNLIALQDELRTQTYRPGPYDSFYIHEPKRRLISAAPFRDRVVHHFFLYAQRGPQSARYTRDSSSAQRGPQSAHHHRDSSSAQRGPRSAHHHRERGS